MSLKDLNNSYIENDGNFNISGDFADYSTSGKDSNVMVYFRDLEKRLIQHIRSAQLIVGCVAWLTNERILEAI